MVGWHAGFPFAAARMRLGRQALALSSSSAALSPAPGMPQPAASLVVHPACKPLDPVLHFLPPLSPTASTAGQASKNLEAAATLAATASASMQHTADTMPLPAQPRKLTALASLPARPPSPAASAKHASQASPPRAVRTPPPLSAPKAAPLRWLPPPPPALPPTLARRPPPPPASLGSAPLQARPTGDQAVTAAKATRTPPLLSGPVAAPLRSPPPPLSPTLARRPPPPARQPPTPPAPLGPAPPQARPTGDQAVTAAQAKWTPPWLSAPMAAPLRSLPPPPHTLLPTLASRPPPPPIFLGSAPLQARPTVGPAVTAVAGSVAAATAAAGLRKISAASQPISPAEPPSNSPQSAISLRPPLHAQAFRTAAQAQAPRPSRVKPAAPNRTALAPSPAQLAQMRKKEEAAENMKAAVLMVDKIEAAGYAAVPQVCCSLVSCIQMCWSAVLLMPPTHMYMCNHEPLLLL